MKISILDHGLLTIQNNYLKAYNEVIELCQYAKDLGFYSFWISEQHNVNSLVISSPLILLNHLANKVGKIKLGCGGIMLANYQAYSVAEQIQTLNLLHPDRFIYGFGSNIGTKETIELLRPSLTSEEFQQKLLDVDNYINGKNSVFLRVNPNISQKIVLVMLVTSEQSAIFAAKNKFVINYGWFLNPSIIYAETVINSYFEAYKTAWNENPSDIGISVNIVSGINSASASKNHDLLAFYRSFANPNEFSFFPTFKDFNLFNFDDEQRKNFVRLRKSIFNVYDEKDMNRLNKLCLDLKVNHLMILPTLADINERKIAIKNVADFYFKRSKNEKSC
ncbi:LLM class flavin-dependent oxidoreductase [Mycoplasmopsis bovis]|uniref:LLM class flavin-dependent oxidoreductase n=1 Tax=Mycoplasmopsis bovis TaxID=28903 RepID=UPI003C2E0E75